MSQPSFDFTPKKTRADQVREAFEKFHAANPRVWDLFEKFTLQVVRAGRKNYSAAAIFQQIRWHVDITTRSEEVKLNNNFSPYYGRMFHVKYPEHKGFFRSRQLITRDRPACKPNLQVFKSPEVDE
jgi:hypothetical protein